MCVCFFTLGGAFALPHEVCVCVCLFLSLKMKWLTADGEQRAAVLCCGLQVCCACSVVQCSAVQQNVVECSLQSAPWTRRFMWRANQNSVVSISAGDSWCHAPAPNNSIS